MRGVSIPQRDFRELQEENIASIPRLPLQFQSLKGILGNCKELAIGSEINRRAFQSLKGILGNCKSPPSIFFEISQLFQSLKGILGNCKAPIPEP